MAHAVLVNVVPQVQLVSLAEMVMMVNQAEMATKEALVGMLDEKIDCYRYHLNANAWPNPVHPDLLVPKDPMVLLVMLAVLAATVLLDLKDHLDLLDPLVTMVKTVHLANVEKTDV